MRGADAPWFAFIVHARDLEDVRLTGPGGLLYRYSADDDDFRRKLRTVGPLVIGDIRFGVTPIWGELIAVIRLPEDMVGHAAVDAVAEAVHVASERGARVVGLGALASPVTKGGLKLAPRLPPGVTLTTGNAYTAAAVLRNVIEACESLGLGRSARVAVVGSTGSVGAAAARLLAQAGFRLLLVGRTALAARRAFEDLASTAGFSGDVAEAGGCDVIVVATSNRKARLDPAVARPGAVVIDIGQPSCFGPGDRNEFRKRGVYLVEGAMVRIPGFSCSYDWRLSSPRDAFACLAETYLFAQQGIREHSLGRPDTALALRLERLAEKRGIAVRPLGVGPRRVAKPRPSRRNRGRSPPHDRARTTELERVGKGLTGVHEEIDHDGRWI